MAEPERAGAPAVFLDGDPAYYRRLGWRPASELGVTPPSARNHKPACQAVALPGWEPWMRGALVYAETFWVLDFVGLRGDLVARARASVGRRGQRLERPARDAPVGPA